MNPKCTKALRKIANFCSMLGGCVKYDDSLCETNIVESFVSGGKLSTLEIHELPILE